MIIQVLAVIMAFILGGIVGAGIIVGIALCMDRRMKNGDKKESV